ncbi:hypothetical protein [Bacteroides gallinaceum]|uniref:hypothetical protein n=1 Tax=Bacteroides gallinaceum TaxID=1462571 RepID=UPI0025AA45A2|nr:hypothetical protein [Bacteroides gallinaceum]MDN0067523.1 hypothetical protein [Bacteroides gallinaceum]
MAITQQNGNIESTPKKETGHTLNAFIMILSETTGTLCQSMQRQAYLRMERNTKEAADSPTSR